MSSYRYMRIMVIFDLPVITKNERHLATTFRRALLKDGFEMLQYSVYTRLCRNRDNADVHVSRMQKEAPKTGSIRILMLTENQYANMKILSGKKTVQEKRNLCEQLTFF